MEYRHGELVWTERVWKPGSFHGVPWIASVETWQVPWSPMDSSVWGWWSVTTAGKRMQWNALDSRSSEVSVLISGRLRRMVSEVFGKHFGGLYSWSNMSSSFVSPSVASLSHCESFHSCICMAQDPCPVTFVLFAPRFIHMSSMSG